MSAQIADFDISGIRVRFRGLRADLEERFDREWSAFRGSSGPPLVDLEVRAVTTDREFGRYDPKAMRAHLSRDEARFEMAEGRAKVDAQGVGQVHLEAATEPLAWFTLLNLFRGCLAWRLPRRAPTGGAMLHAAGAVLDGRAFVLVGAEGAGKSTWARLAAGAGATVLSDDVILVDSDGEGYVVAAAPLASTHRVEYRSGRHPLAALLFPRHGRAAGLTAASSLLTHARVLANLPFVAEGVEGDPRIGAAVDGLVQRVPCFDLTFAPDAGFVDLLRRWPPSPG